MELIATQKVISGNRIFLGPDVRRALDVKEGEYVSIITDGENIILKKVTA